jgi:hypothetical protein
MLWKIQKGAIVMASSLPAPEQPSPEVYMNMQSMKSHSLFPIAIIICLILMVTIPTGFRPVLAEAQAITLTVDTTIDDPYLSACTGAGNDCSLRGAVEYVNADLSSAFVIEIPDGTYTLDYDSGSLSENLNDSGDVDILNPAVTLQGASMSGTLIDGNDTDRVIDIIGYGQTIIINDLTVYNGHLLSGEGGGGGIRIYTGNDLTLNRVTIRNNQVEGSGIPDSGGGIGSASNVHLTVNDSSIHHNSANQGGGIQAVYNVLVVHNTTFQLNHAEDKGGGLNTYNGGTITIDGSLFDQNDGNQGGGYFNSAGASLTLSDSVFQDNSGDYSGGGMELNGTAVISNASFYHNSTGEYGGGIMVNQQASLQNVTLVDNTAPGGYGGGLCAYGSSSVDLDHITITGDSAASLGDALYVFIGTTVNTTSSIFSSPNSGNTCYVFPLGSLISNGYNLATDASCNLIGSGDKPTQDPLFGLYADHGGLTPTLSLLFNSPAIDAGNPADPPGRLDQRGVPILHGRSDMGAYEYVPPIWLPMILK